MNLRNMISAEIKYYILALVLIFLFNLLFLGIIFLPPIISALIIFLVNRHCSKINRTNLPIFRIIPFTFVLIIDLGLMLGSLCVIYPVFLGVSIDTASISIANDLYLLNLIIMVVIVGIHQLIVSLSNKRK